MNGARPWLLLVEDDPIDEKLTRRALLRAGADVPTVVARDGAEALERLAAASEAGQDLPALVLLDLKLPRVGGLEVLARVRADARMRFVPIVILTGSREERDLHECYRLGGNAYVRKPLEFDVFATAMGHIAGFWLGFNEPAPRGAA